MPKFEDRFRIIANLGKHQVIKVAQGSSGTRFTIELTGSDGKPTAVTLTADLGIRVDVRQGDLLTLYTEVLTDDDSLAKPPLQ
jgi:hypothetical protein